MKRLTMLVTPDGKWVFPDTDEFFAALGDPAPDYDAVAFAVKNLGFVTLQVIEQSIAEIELHPRNVELPALLAVQQQLLSISVRLFRIKYFDGGWQSEISSSSEHTINRLSELCARSFTPRASNRFIIQPRDFSLIFEDEDSQLRPLALKWRVSFGHFDPDIISLAARHQLLSRMMIVGVKPRDPEPVFRFVGDGFRWLGSDGPFGVVGEKIANQPDKDYGEWVAEFYKSVATTGQPRYDLVSATIHTDKPVPYNSHYERLLLPWKTPSDEVFVTLTSRIVEPDLAWEAAAIEDDSSTSRKFARSS